MNYDKLLAVKAILKEDIILLQETRGEKEESLWRKQFGRLGAFSFFQKNSRGVGALCSMKFGNPLYFRDKNGRIAGCVASCTDKKIGFISAYAPNLNGTHNAQTSYIDFLINLEKIIDEVSKKSDYLIVGGDFNLILDATLDAEKLNAKTYPIIVEELFELLGRTGLNDAYRFLYPEKQTYTYAPKGENEKNIFRRLDYFFVSDTLLPYIKSIENIHTHLSDHKILKIEFVFKDDTKGNTFWRHNDRMLKNPEYLLHVINEYHSSINEYIQSNNLTNMEDADPSQLWEYIKYRLGKCSRDFCAQHKKRIENTTKLLREQLNELENNPITNNKNIKETKNAIDVIEQEEVKAIIFQSRVSYYENNEKPTGFFLRKIKENYVESNIIQLRDGNGTELSKDEINKEIFSFYSKLFEKRSTSQPSDALNKILDSLPQLNNKECDRLIRPITEEEITNILFNKMNPGKSPGSDGITVDVYKKLWELLKTPLANSIISATKKGELAELQKKSVIRLIQKKGKDTSLIKNWRPISLINVDTKILSRLITARLEEVIVKICSKEQLAYIKGRNITEGIRMIDFSISEKERKNDEGFIVGFDFEKAFDFISHDYIYNTLKKFGFPDEFIGLIKTLYNGAESTVMNNGKTTPYFKLGRSCRQGDCLSPYLFILAVEPLIRLINANRQIKRLSNSRTYI